MAKTAKAGACNGLRSLSVVVVLGNKNFPAGADIGGDLIFILPVPPAGLWIITALPLTLAEPHGCSLAGHLPNHEGCLLFF